MRAFQQIPLLFLLFAIPGIVSGLQVTPASHCATHCLDSPAGNQFKASDSNTNTSDISCRDLDYSTTDAGIKFRRCVECLQTSRKVNQDESDLRWYIYNLRYTVTTCLYGAPKPHTNGTVASPCNIDKACNGLKAPLTGDDVKPNPNTTWDYCTANDGTFMGSALSLCINCLQATEGEVYLSNFFTALETGCRQDPSDGSLLGLSGSAFSTNAVNRTDPNGGKTKDTSSGSLSPSAIAGIAIGVVVIFVIALGLFFTYFRRERAQDAWDRATYYQSYPGPPGSSPYQGAPGGNHMSQAYRRYYTGNAFTEKAPRYSTSGDYYDRMEAQLRVPQFKPGSDFKSQQSGGSSTTATGNDTSHVLTSRRSEGQLTPARTPSPALVG